MGRQCHSLISLLVLVIASSTQFAWIAEGRILPRELGEFQRVNEEKVYLRGQIGSRPPRCDHRCSTCGHCEAVQVPTNPQIHRGAQNSTAAVSTVAYARGDGYSNYKPMSWKCKCGNLIFNP